MVGRASTGGTLYLTRAASQLRLSTSIAACKHKQKGNGPANPAMHPAIKLPTSSHFEALKLPRFTNWFKRTRSPVVEAGMVLSRWTGDDDNLVRKIRRPKRAKPAPHRCNPVIFPAYYVTDLYPPEKADQGPLF